MFYTMEYSSITTNNSLGSTTGDGVGTDFEPQELRSSTSEPKPQDVSELALIIFSAVLFGLGFIGWCICCWKQAFDDVDNQEKLAKKDDILAAKASPIQKLVSLTEESQVPSNTTTNIQNASIKKKPLGPKSKRAKRIGKRLTKLKLLNDALKCRITALETNVSSDNALQQQNSNYKQRTFGGMPRMILSTAPSNTSAFPVPDNIWNNTGRSDYYNPYAPGISKSDSRQMYHPSYTRFPQGSRQHMIQESRSAGMIPVQTSYLSKISLPPPHSNAKLHMNQIPAVLRSARSLKAAWPPPSRSNSPNAVGAVQGVPSALTKYPQHSTNKLDDLLVQSFTDITSQYSAEDDYEEKSGKQRKKGGRRKHEKSSGRKSRKIKY